MPRRHPEPCPPRALLALCLVLAAGPWAAAEAPESRPNAPEAIASREFTELIGAIHAELAALGEPPPATSDGSFVPGERLPPLRELCLFARELGRKAERLARARGAERPPAPLPPLRARPELADLRALLQHVRAELASLRPDGPAPEPLEVRAETPGLALDALRRADRALAELLLQPPSVGDVHHRLTRALAHASAIRARFPGRRLPLAPPLEEESGLDEAWTALADCWRQTQELCAAAGLQRVSLAPPPGVLAAGLERLHALACILGDELELLYQLHGEPKLLPPASHPGERRPQELRQRAEHLGRQLRDLQDLAVTRGALDPREVGS